MASTLPVAMASTLLVAMAPTLLVAMASTLLVARASNLVAMASTLVALELYSGFRVGGTGTRRCLLDGDPYKPPFGGIVPSILQPLCGLWIVMYFLRELEAVMAMSPMSLNYPVSL